MKLVNDDFIAAIENELQTNQVRGNWPEWRPAREELISELDKHMNKLRDALRGIAVQSGGLRVTEHAADVASLAMKASEVFGTVSPIP